MVLLAFAQPSLRAASFILGRNRLASSFFRAILSSVIRVPPASVRTFHLSAALTDFCTQLLGWKMARNKQTARTLTERKALGKMIARKVAGKQTRNPLDNYCERNVTSIQCDASTERIQLLIAMTFERSGHFIRLNTAEALYLVEPAIFSFVSG